MKNIKLQYYLRGLGVGILVTALIMGFALPKEGKTLTDAQIKERALELGMVDSNSLVLSDLQGDEFVKVEANEETVETEETKPMEESTDSEEITETEAADTEEIIATEETTEVEEATEIAESEEQSVIEAVQESEAQTDIEQQVAEQPRVNGAINTEGDTVTIEIRSGANSYNVSKILADMGLVADAWAYDSYLCDNGYSKRIHTGKYLIAVGTSEEEIAQIITGNR